MERIKEYDILKYKYLTESPAFKKFPSIYKSAQRKQIPALRDPNLKFDVEPWEFLKKFINLDLTKIPFPVFFNEPLSLLQRCAEIMATTFLLELAD